MRIVLSVVLPLVLPTLLYFAYMSVQRRRGVAAAVQPTDVPWSWLVAAGAVLLAASLLAFFLLEQGTGRGTYHPARIIDGRIEPGYFDNDVKQPD
jgi:uncharacterized protein DUF6111